MHALRIWFDHVTSRREVIVLFDSIIEVLSSWHDHVALEQSLQMIAYVSGLPPFRPANSSIYIYWTQRQHPGSTSSGSAPAALAGSDITGIDAASWHRMLNRMDKRGWNDILYAEDEGRAETRLQSPSRVPEEERRVIRVGVVTLEATRLAVERYLRSIDSIWRNDTIRQFVRRDIDTTHCGRGVITVDMSRSEDDEQNQ